MAHQIVATSVPRGLDGVSGYQTVLKSSGIPPRVFDRLKARSGYSHRYPHGDSRNPVIYVHRIEELGGSRWHVLGCIRDAGSDHTGRSNFLAHMLAIDAAEARGKPGGPAAAAMARGCFLESWNRPPDPAAPAKTLVAADRPAQPGDAPAWTAAGLDPGLAGDLAAAAMASQKVVLVARPDDDVLALFADSLRLVEPSKRWGVTFNTCAIEDFDGIWKAIRADLGDARDLRDGKASLIDLTKNPRGSTNPYAQFARGESTALPWQKPVASVRPAQEIPESSNKATPQTVEPSAPRGDPRKALPKQSGRAATRSSRDRRQRYEEPDSPRVPWHAIAIGTLSLLAIAGLVAIPYRDQILNLVRTPTPRHIAPKTEQSAAAPVTPPPIEVRDTPEYRAAQKLKEARERLTAGVKGKTHGTLRSEANDLLIHIHDLRGGQGEEAPLKLMSQDGPVRDPQLGVQEVIAACDRVLQVLEKPTGGLKLEEAIDAESQFNTAVARLESLRNEVERLAAEERKTRNAERMAKQADDDRNRRQQAFAEFQSMSKTVRLPVAAARTDVLGDNDPTEAMNVGTVELGPFSFAYLMEPKFRLAVPRDKVGGKLFKAEIVKEEGSQDPRWDIRYVPSDVGADADQAKPRTLAYLVARQGTLVLDVPRSNEIAQSPFAMLRRSVILVEAKDPAAPDGPAVVREIRLVEPTTAKTLVIDLLSERQQELRFPLPPGQFGSLKLHDGSVASLKLPISSVRFDAMFPNGKTQTHEFSEEDTDLGIQEWKQFPLATLDANLEIHALIKLSLPQASISVQTAFSGKHEHLYSKDKVKEFFVNQPAEMIKKMHRMFDTRVDGGRKFSFVENPTKQGNEKIAAWFDMALASQQRGGLGLPMQGHETIRKSFEVFLKEQYAEAGKDMKPIRRPDLPGTWDDFVQRCSQVNNESQWKSVFTDRIDSWSTWFWPKFESHYQEQLDRFKGALAGKYTIHINAISSLAYDGNNEYVVPLVIGDASPLPELNRDPVPTETKPTPQHGDAPGDVDEAVVPRPNSTEKSSVGIE